MTANKLSTGGADLPRESKKGEGEKRKSPCTPYREKGKGKESKPVVCSTGLFARAYARGTLAQSGRPRRRRRSRFTLHRFAVGRTALGEFRLEARLRNTSRLHGKSRKRDRPARASRLPG